MPLVTLCHVEELPAPGAMRTCAVGGLTLCVANLEGRYAAVDNECPHRGGPLAEGTLEDGKVLCPWHAWGFDLATGKADHDPSEQVRVYRLEVNGTEVQVELPAGPG